MNFEGKRIAVLGLGKSGVALARELSRRGAQVLLSDTRSQADLADAVAKVRDLPGVQVESGGHTDRVVEGDLLIISPGVSVHQPLVRKALDRGVTVMGEVEIAFRLSPAPFVAVTGTNGKSTTATLIHKMLPGRSILAGNIGNPLVAEVAEAPPGGFVVAEISSFQLETVHDFRPRVAVLTNVTPDHLDRHPTLEEYFAAKARLFALQGPEDAAVFSADDPESARMAALLEAGELPPWLPEFPVPAQPARPRILRFSARGPVERGAWYQDAHLWYRDRGEAERLLPWGFAGLPGPHNLANGLAAVTAARWLGASVEEMRRAFEEHHPLHHRLEEVGAPGGVRFVDDSKATNPGSVEAALESFAEPIHLIAGGKDKGTDFHDLAAVIARRAHSLLLIGEAADRLEAEARAAGMERIHRCSTLQEAVGLAWKNAQPGDVVLLSPACASFDMFRNAEDRGRQFAEAVSRLPAAP